MDAEKLRQRIATATQQRELYVARANQEAARFLGQIQAMEGILAEMEGTLAEVELPTPKEDDTLLDYAAIHEQAEDTQKKKDD